MNKLKVFLSVVFVTAFCATQLTAQIVTFDAVWTDPAGGPATAVAKFDVDTSILPNPGSVPFNSPFGDAGISNFTMEVFGASSGNGTFVESDFDGGLVWDTLGATLDLSMELVGQPTGFDPFGTPSGAGGDLNFFSSTGAPTGTFFFTLTTNSGIGDTVVLQSLTPRVVPEPSALAVLSVGLAGLASRRRRI